MFNINQDCDNIQHGMNNYTKSLLDFHYEMYWASSLDPYGRIGTAGFTAPDPVSLIPLSHEESRQWGVKNVAEISLDKTPLMVIFCLKIIRN